MLKRIFLLAVVLGAVVLAPPTADVRPDLPEFCAQRYDLDFHFQGADGTFRLQTTYEGFGYDDWWPRAFTWDVTEGTGLYAGWSGSGTYTFDFRGRSFVRSILTLNGAIGPAG
jgi:hypothetical protein